MARGMTIGTLAKAAGVNVETIRYYERLGLIDQPLRVLGRQRVYSPAILDRLSFVRRAQLLGFTLAEIRQLADLADNGSRDDIRRIARQRHARLVAHAKQLVAMSSSLKRLLDASGRGTRGVDPIIAALRGEAGRPHERD